MLRVNQLVGSGAGGGKQTPVTFIGTGSKTTAATSWTFTAQNIGVASAKRYVIVVALVRDAGSQSISNITINGAATTVLASRGSASYFGAIRISSAPVTTGTTANIVVSVTDTSNAIAIAVYTCEDISSFTPVGTVNVTENDPSETIALSDGGFVLAAAWNGSAGASVTWTGLTEDADFEVAGVQTIVASFASKNINGGGSETITADFSANSSDAMIAVSMAA